MRRERLVQLTALGVMLACLAASQVVTASLSSSAGRNRLVYTDRAEEGDPPEVALGIAMGAFRGLFVNMLWMRANERKNEGRYYDAVDLARTITKLQPRFPRVWVFHAWNLAYNISVATNTFEERWNWVNQGIRLLREEGIPKNPNDLLLYRELAWIHLHKVQGVMDDANAYYKWRFAEEWTIAVGAPPRRTKATIDTHARVIELAEVQLRPIMNAKDTLAEVESEVPIVTRFVELLRTRAQIDLRQKYFDDRGQGPGEKLLRNYEIYKAALRNGEIREGVLPPEANRAVLELLISPESQPAHAPLVNHIRKRLLLDKYHMEPEKMMNCMEKFGPLDWRHPASHGIFWSWSGVTLALKRATEENRADFDFLNTDRLTIHGVQEMYRNGEIVYNILAPRRYLAMPCADFIQTYSRIMDEEEYRDRGGKFTSQKRSYTPFAAGYENFLRDAIRFLYRRGQIAEANEYKEKLLNWTGANFNNPERVNEISVPLDEFVFNEIVKDDRFAVPDVALAEIAGSLQAAYTLGLMQQNSQLFEDQFTYARRFHAVFVERQIQNTNINQGAKARMEFTIDRDFQVFAGWVLATMVAYVGGNDAEIMYAGAPDELKAAAWAHFGIEQGDDSDIRVRFPQPPKRLMDEYKQRAAERDERRRQFQGVLEQK